MCDYLCRKLYIIFFFFSFVVFSNVNILIIKHDVFLFWVWGKCLKSLLNEIASIKLKAENCFVKGYNTEDYKTGTKATG